MPRATEELRGPATRAARRAAQRAVRPEPAAAWWRLVRRWRLVAWGAATAILLALVAAAIQRKVTWYLAVDQLGYLLFAHDLLHGKVFHDWAPAHALAALLPDPTDVLAQTYVWDHGRLYSRYAPGFPLLLAGWVGIFGDAAAHLLNPILFLVLLGVLIGLEWRVHRSLWRGTALVALVMTIPTGVSSWALTPTRDMAGHLFAFIGLLLLAGRGPLPPRRALAAGLALGWAGSIRPDTVLYLLPAAVLALGRWWPRGDRRALGRWAAAGVLGITIGLAPSLAYYWAATGNPLVPTQSMEVSEFLGTPETPTQVEPTEGRVGYPSAAWRGTTLSQVSGGGLKLEHLPETLPGNWKRIRTAYGDVLLGFAFCGLVVAAILRPTLAIAVCSYLVVALLFYSCWARPYGRYLISMWLLLPVLVVEGAAGMLDLVRYVGRHGRPARTRWLAAAAMVVLLGGYLIAAPQEDGTALPQVTALLVLGTALSLGAAAVWPHRRIATVAVPVLVLALAALACGRLGQTLDSRAPFQRPEAARAAAVVRQTLEPPAVVITSEELGRPLENLEYYSDVRALYLTDLARWQIPIYRAVFELMIAEMEPYLLIPRSLPERAHILAMLQPHVALELVREIPPGQAYDFFVASPFHAGVPMELWHIR